MTSWVFEHLRILNPIAIDYSTQDVLAEAEEHYASDKTRIMDHLRSIGDLESPNIFRISSGKYGQITFY